MSSYNLPVSGRRGKLRLDFNENTVGPSFKVIKAIRNVSVDDFVIYPEYSVLREKIAVFYNLKKSNIIVTNGGDGGIRNLMDSFVEENGEVILVVPSFSMFKFYADLRGAKITEILFNKDLSFPVEKLLNEINSKTNLVVLCNPNNPTGSRIERKNIIEIIKKAEENNCLVLVDEAYFDISKETVIDLINNYTNLVVLRSFSKGIGLAGLRIGFLASNRKIISVLLKTSSPYSVSSLSVVAVLEALKDKKHVDDYVSEVIKAREFTLNEFKKIGVRTFPSNANFFLAEFDNPNRVIEKLREKKILVRSMSGFPLIKNCVRVSVGTREQMKYFVSSLKEVLL